MLFLRNFNFRNFTTFKILYQAKFFSVINNLQDIEKLISFLQKNNLRFFILGGGSNILFKNQYFDGLIIKPQFKYFNLENDGLIKTGANVNISNLVFKLCRSGYQGLEWAGGLPGEVGGAIRGNAGCFGGEIKDVFKELTAVNLSTKELKKFYFNDLNFDYRSSFFKKNKDWLIIEAYFNLQPNFNAKDLLKIMMEKINYRKERHPLNYPNAGSIFKNIEFEKAPENLKDLATKYHMVKGNKIPTAFVIEFLGLKGKQIGGAKISEKHANFIINFNNAQPQDILNLIFFVKEKAKEKFDLDLEEEIEIVD